MPIGDDAGTAGGNGTEDKSGKGADDSAENKSGNEGDKSKAAAAGGKKDDDDPLKGKVVFDSQADVDAMIQRRVARETKKLTDDAKLTTEQRLEKERDDALKLVRERDIRDDFVAKADISPAIAQRIFLAYKDDIDINDAGKATNIDEVLKQAKRDLPALFGKAPGGGLKPGGGDGGSGTGGDGKTGGDMNAALRRMAGKG